MRLRFLALGAAAMLSAAGCSGSHHVSTPPTTTAATTPIRTAPPTGPDPDVIPAVITPAYVDAVFVVLNHVYGNASRALVASRSVTPAVKADLRAVFNDPVYATQLGAAQQALAQGVIDNVRPHAGDLVTVLSRLVTARPSCIFFEAKTNFSQVQIHLTPTPASEYYEFAPKQPGNDPMHLNPTPWAISFEQVFLVTTVVKSPCVG